MSYFSRQKRQERKDAATLSSFRGDPSSFLKKHTVNSLWNEVGGANNQSSPANQFYLVEQHNNQPTMRPGSILGNLNKHPVKNYILTNDQEQTAGVGLRLVGGFQAPQLAMRRAPSDAAPNLPAMQNSALDLQPIRQGTTIHTMDLSGCSIKREQHSLFHVQPHQDGAPLQTALGANTFGKNDYGQDQQFVMFRKKRNGLKYYAQSVDGNGLPALRKGYL